ncbi:putative acetyltransferase [Candidatus Propionivibrio aalborgensis]|uniref:Putative acetyltransferase n=1 Tax=Candidatus Propionivibrio aalborgensis TaxID=1860101 RepID=A0A1A8XWF4_9RHOO|nr:acyltransferase [Candidatus Propionivibrio aalborgensis]SBT09334.1 putative acetyltransferase [Candidatus Propionivibrio aalborgensis]
MNLRLLLRRLLGRGGFEAGHGTVLARSARIIDTGRRGGVRIRIGCQSRIEGQLLVFAHGGTISVGDWCFVGPGTCIWSGASIKIGDRVMISHNVNIFDNLTHPLDPARRHLHFRHIIEQGHPQDIDLGDRPVVIEDDAWIAASATILRGVRIGRGAIVGAAAVVTRDVPPMSVVAGNPARIVRHLDPIDNGLAALGQ